MVFPVIRVFLDRITAVRGGFIFSFGLRDHHNLSWEGGSVVSFKRLRFHYLLLVQQRNVPT